MAAGGTYDHPEIDDFLARADEVLEACLTPTTLAGSIGTSSGIPAKLPGPKKPGHTKSKRLSDEVAASQSA